MAPKKKKSAKLKMSDEERIAYEEQKRLAEEEMRKKKEDMLAQFLKVNFSLHSVHSLLPYKTINLDSSSTKLHMYIFLWLTYFEFRHRLSCSD